MEQSPGYIDIALGNFVHFAVEVGGISGDEVGSTASDEQLESIAVNVVQQEDLARDVTIAGLDLLDIEIIEVIVVEIEGAGIEAVDGGGVIQVEDIDMISAAGEKCSDDVGQNVLHVLPDTITADRGFLGFSSVSDHGVDGWAIHHGNTSSKGCEKEKTVGVNHMVDS